MSLGITIPKHPHKKDELGEIKYPRPLKSRKDFNKVTTNCMSLNLFTHMSTHRTILDRHFFSEERGDRYFAAQFPLPSLANLSNLIVIRELGERDLW